MQNIRMLKIKIKGKFITLQWEQYQESTSNWDNHTLMCADPPKAGTIYLHAENVASYRSDMRAAGRRHKQNRSPQRFLVIWGRWKRCRDIGNQGIRKQCFTNVPEYAIQTGKRTGGNGRMRDVVRTARRYYKTVRGSF